jgi:hypothetical protein
VDETWISDRVQLIPRLKQWVQQQYPGTRIGITEYSWGAEHHINGATAQADVLGIFGREELDLATRWVVPARTSPTFKAFQMYRNYDAQYSTFGETSIRVSVPDPDQLSAFAAERSADRVLTLMVVNKVLTGNTPIEVQFTNDHAYSAAQVWQLTAANQIERLADTSVTSNQLSSLLPAQSITLFVVPTASSAPRWSIGTHASAGQIELWLHGTAGYRYMIESSANLTLWEFHSSQILVADRTRIVVPDTDSAKFFRASIAP